MALKERAPVTGGKRKRTFNIFDVKNSWGVVHVHCSGIAYKEFKYNEQISLH